MNAPETAPPLFSLPEVRSVPAGRPLEWLRRARHDYSRYSAFYGFCFAAMGLAIHFVFRAAPQYASSLAMGFLLVGPFLAIGLYELSRQQESGGKTDFRASLIAWRSNPGAIGIYVLLLTVIFLVWARASLVTFALFSDQGMPNLAAVIAQILRLENITFLAVWFGVGLLFASIVFAISVVSVPFLLDARTEAVTAAAASVLALARNLPAMLVWASLIVGLTLIGLLTFYLGLVLVVPLIGHATWHAYRDLINTGAPTPSS